MNGHSQPVVRTASEEFAESMNSPQESDTQNSFNSSGEEFEQGSQISSDHIRQLQSGIRFFSQLLTLYRYQEEEPENQRVEGKEQTVSHTGSTAAENIRKIRC
jgi:hypothetical protein